MTFERDDDLMSDGNLTIVCEFLSLCEDASTLQILRETYPADVLRSASRLLDRVSFQRIRHWTLELNQKAA